MFGSDFLRRIITVNGEIVPKGKIKDWPYVLVYACVKCHAIRLFWIEEMADSDTISCRAQSCDGMMTLRKATMKEAQAIPTICERIELHAAMGH